MDRQLPYVANAAADVARKASMRAPPREGGQPNIDNAVLP